MAENRLNRQKTWQITLEGRGVLENQKWRLDVAAGKSARREFEFRVPANLPTGRHIWALRCMMGEELDGSDAFVGIDVK